MEKQYSTKELREMYPTGTKVALVNPYNQIEFCMVIGYNEFYGLQVETWDTPMGYKWVSPFLVVIMNPDNILDSLRF